MSRKSVVKDICGIFESETSKCHTLKTTCDQGDSKDINDKGQCAHVDSKNMHQSKNKNTPKARQNVRSVQLGGNLKKDFPKYGTIKDRISKLNAETALPRASTIFSNNSQTDDFSKHCPNRKLRNSVDSSNSQKAIHTIQKFYQCEIKSTAKHVKIEPAHIIQPSVKISESKTNSDNSNAICINATEALDREKITMSETPASSDNSTLISMNSIKESDGGGSLKTAMEQNESGQKSPGIKASFPIIPPKPKYFNKIKPHPNMPSISKKQLNEKIGLFNNLSANSERQLDGATSSENTPSPRHRKSNYEEIWNFKEENSGVSNKTYTEAKTNCNNDYDVLQNNSAITKLRPAPKPPRKGNDYANLNPNKSHTRDPKAKRADSKTAKNIQNLRTMSKDHSLENEGFVVVKFSKPNDEESDTSSEDSSDEDLATEYDVIENLNVTKITVERRYKVTDNAEEDPATFNVKRETYYDHNLNPRIERISRHVQRRQDDCSNDVFSNKTCTKKSAYIIQELLETEVVYFNGLLKVYEDYLIYFKDSTDICAESMGKVFGNFEEIYNAQMHFYGQLTDCGDTVDALAEIFLINDDLFSLYEKYILNMHVSKRYSTGECLEAIRARDIQLGNKLNLQSYLLTPFQRLIRYRLLLKNLQDALENEGNPSQRLDDAISYLNNLIEGTNMHAKIVLGIQNSPIDLSNRGKFLMIGDCYVKNNGKKYFSTVVLFDDIIVFTKKADAYTFIYKGSINLSDLYIRSITEELTSFQLQNFTEFKKKNDNKYVYDLEVSAAETKQEWVKKLESLLWNQFEAYRK